jgi:type I restriction enzyme S subunit
MVLRSKGILRQEFVYFYLINPKTVEWLQTLAEARSGTFPQITFDQLRELVINIPSDELLAEASKLCSNWLKKLKFNHIQIRTLEKLRDNLLPKLMSGEVRVSYAQGTVAS